MSFTPLQISTNNGDSAADVKVQLQQSCSPRSMYSLATAVRVSRRSIIFDPDKLQSSELKIFRKTH